MRAPVRAALTLLAILLITPFARGDGFIIIERPPVLPRPQPVPRRTAFPLEVKNHTVRADIRDTVATTRVEQVFHNPSSVQMEGTYMFPLPEGASVQKFSMWMDGKEVHGEVLDADKARSTYEEIVRKSRDPALLEYVGSRLYRARVFPIPANGDVRIALEYSETIRVNEGLGAYRYPLNTEKFSARNIDTVVITVNITSQLPLRSVFCPSHTAVISRANDREARVSYEARDTRPDRDFIVHYQGGEAEFGLALLSYRQSGEEGFFMARVSPPLSVASEKVISKDVCFVVDTSGSMAGDKIAQARRALAFCLSSLRPKDRFSLISFSTETRPFRDGLVAASAENVEAAKAEAAKLEAAGGTDIHGALLTAFNARRTDERERPYLIVFVTDGQPTVGETDAGKIQAAARKANDSKSRLFVFGVGHDLNASLLDGLAEDNRGAREYIDEKEDIEVKVSSFFKKVSDPVLGDIELRFGGADVIDTYPRQLPDLFHGSELVVVGRYRKTGSHTVTIAGKRAGESVTWDYKASFAEGSTANDFLPRLWATRKVGYLMDEMRLRGESKEVKDEIIRLAKRYAILTPYTSYLVLEDKAPGGVVTAARPAAPAERMLLRRYNTEPEARAQFKSAGRYRAKAGEDAVKGSKEALGLQSAAQPMAPTYSLGEVNRGAGSNAMPPAPEVRTVGSKTFYHDEGRWIDSEYDGKAAVKKLTAFSDEYFTLLRQKAELGKYLALGDRVLVIHEGQAYEITPGA